MFGMIMLIDYTTASISTRFCAVNTGTQNITTLENRMWTMKAATH